MDFLIKNGTVYDPARHRLERRDLAIVGGRLAEPSPDGRYRQVIDASGCLVTPGLIDFHVHFFAAEAGVCPDANSFCNGITTVVDGGSTGCSLYPLYYRTQVMNSRVRILNDLLVASGGQVTWCYHEDLSPELFDEAAILRLFREYPGNLVGLKARLSRYVIEDSRAEASVRRMLEIAGRAGTRLVVHITDCSLPLERLAALLRPGDVICHIYQGRGHTCLDENGRVLPALWEARRRGVILDACHGVGNYDLEICRAAVAQGLVPDVISSDNNANGSFLQPLHSLPRILSKYLDFGMPLADVLDCATATPARLVGRPDLGTLAAGTEADVAILRLDNKPVHHEDAAGHCFTGNHILIPQMTFKAGVPLYCQADFA